MAAYTMINPHTAVEKRVFSIKNIVINLDTATIKKKESNYENLKEKTERGHKRKKYVFLVWTAQTIVSTS